jgi:hypothetical protein
MAREHEGALAIVGVRVEEAFTPLAQRASSFSGHGHPSGDESPAI